MIQVHKIAQLARLALTEKEEQVFEPQLNAIFKYFEELSTVHTEGVEPLITPSEIEYVLREDSKQVTLTVEEALQNAPERSGNLFRVPPVV